MRDILRVMELLIVPRLLRSAEWKSKLLDYNNPVMEVLWTKFGKYGIDLYKVYPCEREKALFHVHLRPFAARILSGTCCMDIGYGKGKNEPPVASELTLAEGSSYSMPDQDGWHRIYPVNEPSVILMVIGSPHRGPSPVRGGAVTPLSLEKQMEILGFFRNYYPRSEAHWNNDFKRYLTEALKMSLEELEKALKDK